MSREQVERQARALDADNRKADPDMKVFWFPNDSEVRLLGLLPSVPRADDGAVHPFHFRPNLAADLPAPSGVALIRPDEFGKLDLPVEWGRWDDAVALEADE